MTDRTGLYITKLVDSSIREVSTRIAKEYIAKGHDEIEVTLAVMAGVTNAAQTLHEAFLYCVLPPEKRDEAMEKARQAFLNAMVEIVKMYPPEVLDAFTRAADDLYQQIREEQTELN